MAFFKRESTIRRVEPGDPGYGAVVASLDTPPGPARAEAAARAAAAMTPATGTEFYVYDGQDGTPVAAAQLTPVRAGVVELWIGVDPTLRRYGIGERVFTACVARAKKLGARTITASTAHVEGMAFMASHGFVATSAVEPESQADEILGVRPTGEPVAGELAL